MGLINISVIEHEKDEAGKFYKISSKRVFMKI